MMDLWDQHFHQDIASAGRWKQYGCCSALAAKLFEASIWASYKLLTRL